MRVIARSTIRRYVDSLKSSVDRRAVDSALRAWFHEVRAATWRNSGELKASYRTASIIDSERVVFNIKGNDYRLVAAIDYESQILFIKWLGTHAEYDKIDVRTIQYDD